MRKKFAVASTLLTGFLLTPLSFAAADRQASEKARLKDSAGGSKAGPAGLDNSNADELRENINSMNFLLQKTPEGSTRRGILLNRATTYVSLARSLLMAAQRSKMSPEERSYLQKAQTDARLVLKAKALTPDVESRAHFILGVSSLYLDEEVIPHLQKSFDLNPKSENSTWTALYLAEEYFEKGQFEQALLNYNRAYPKLTKKEKNLATYKMAWSSLNLKNFVETEKRFLELVANPKDNDFYADAVKDLAYLESQTKTPSAVVALSQELFQKRVEDELIFLKGVAAYYEAHNNLSANSPVVARIFELERDPNSKIQVYLTVVRANRKSYASKKHWHSFVQLIKQIGNNKTADDATLLVSLENETSQILKSFIETYAGRVRSPENISKEELQKSLRSLFAFYLKQFPNAEKKGSVLKLQKSFCEDTKDYACLLEVSRKNLADPKLKNSGQEAAFDELQALDNLQVTAPEKYKKEFIKRTEAYLSTYPHNAEWVKIAYRMAELKKRDHDTKGALKVYQEIFAVDKSPKTQLQIYELMFADGQYEELLKQVPLNAKDPAVKDILREAALKRAIESSKDDKEEAYLAALKVFFSQKPEAAKARIARVDYFNYLDKKQNYDLLEKEIVNLPPAEKNQLVYEKYKIKLWKKNFLAAQFRKAAELDLTSAEQKDNKDALSRRLVAEMAQGQLPSVQSFWGLEASRRSYLLSSIAYLLPEKAIDILRAKPAALTETERDYAALAFRLIEGSYDLAPSALKQNMLGKDFGFRAMPTRLSINVEKGYQSLPMPPPNASPQVFAKKLAKLLPAIRELRKVLPRAIASVSLSDRLRLVERAVAGEERVAQCILNSKIPEGLKPEEADQYKKGLEGAAAEFTGQAQEFSKIAEALKAELAKGSAQKAQDSLPQVEVAKWPLGATNEKAEFEAYGRLLDTKNYLAALFWADFWKADHAQENSTYLRLRIGALLLSRNNDVMRRYLQNELKQESAVELLKEWKEQKPDAS